MPGARLTSLSEEKKKNTNFIASPWLHVSPIRKKSGRIWKYLFLFMYNNILGNDKLCER